jgi:hypothetical protein
MVGYMIGYFGWSRYGRQGVGIRALVTVIGDHGIEIHTETSIRTRVRYHVWAHCVAMALLDGDVWLHGIDA